MYFYQHAATRSHSQPLEWPQVRSKRVAASGRKWPLQASGRKWPQVAASGLPRQFPASGRKLPQVAAPSEWPQVAASGRKWPQVAAFCDFNFHPQSNIPGKLSAELAASYQCDFFYFLSQVLRLARKRAARSYEVLHLSCKIISANVKI